MSVPTRPAGRSPAGTFRDLRELGAELLIPVVEGPTSVLMIILGARRSEEPYAEEDLEMLTTVAHSLELAMARSRVSEIEPAAMISTHLLHLR